MAMVGFKTLRGAEVPKYKHEGDSGMDVKAIIEEPITLGMLERVTVPTGLCMVIPDGHEIQARPRSGLARDFGVVAMFGTIDNPYTGEVSITIINLSKEEFKILPKERIAQIVLVKVEKIQPYGIVGDMPKTSRGADGFGSTGRFDTNEA